jgi:3-methyladenine DNA glycosylase AlkC
MAEPFKNLVNAALIDDAARHLHRTWPGFDRARFRSLATDGLDALELKARAMHVCAALEATLPDDFHRAADILESSLGPPAVGDDLSSMRMTDAGLAGWILWPVGEFVARRGLDHPARALRVLHALTQRFSAEFAIRPFIVRHQDLTLATLATWIRDPSAHVRRLVSEGSRPRLPWGMQLKALIADPSPTLPLLEVLQDDASEYVRRSVANHLNDIAKDHPALLVDWVARYLPGAGRDRRALLKHASRTLTKRGHPGMMKLWGVGRRLAGEAMCSASPKRVSLGGEMTLRVVLRSDSSRTQKLAIDYAVHHVKANGATSPKVFKGWVVDLAPRETRTLTKRHSMRPVTTRRYHAGRHVVDVMVNGQVVATTSFHLLGVRS